MRILLHPGFHKTGTSSAQHFLWVNRETLARNGIDLRLLRHLREPARLAMRLHRDPAALFDLPRAMEWATEGIEGPMAILSCEGLAGHMPGYKDLTQYDTAPASIALIANWLQDRFNAEVITVLTLRPRGSWLGSAWRHHLRGQRLTEDEHSFRKRLRDGGDLAAAADAIEKALHTPVIRLGWGKLTRHPMGPGGAILEQLCPRLDGLQTPPPANQSPDDALCQQFLDLNRSALDDATVIAEKERLAQQAGLTGWPRAKA